jgi:hypothetical protein
MCGVMKIEKKDALLKILIRVANKFVGPHLPDFTKKTRQVNKK